MITEINNKSIASSQHIDKYADKGLTGLCNLGNTCYINSCMQILSHCYELNAILDNIDLKLAEKTLLLYEWRQLKDLMWKTNCVISPKRFIGAIQYIAKKTKRTI